MDAKDLQIARTIGANAFLVYSYAKNLTERVLISQLVSALGISNKTILAALRCLQDYNVITEERYSRGFRQITINNEENWRLQ